jgi:exonuclease VII large subunit
MADEIVAGTPVVDVPVVKAEPSKTEQTALEQGWVPKDDFQGEEHKWVDAGEFLRRGELFGKIDAQNRELKETRKTLQALEQHYLKVQETEYKRALNDLKKQKKDALIENDVETVLDVDEKIDELKEEQLQKAQQLARQAAAQQTVEPHPEFVAWASKNSWYENSKPMRAFADARGQELSGEDKSPSEVLRLVAEEVRKEFPNKFYNAKREEPSSVEGGSNSKQSSNSKVELSELETQIMKKLVGQGVLTKEAYMADIKKQRERA